MTEKALQATFTDNTFFLVDLARDFDCQYGVDENLESNGPS